MSLILTNFRVTALSATRLCQAFISVTCKMMDILMENITNGIYRYTSLQAEINGDWVIEQASGKFTVCRLCKYVNNL